MDFLPESRYAPGTIPLLIGIILALGVLPSFTALFGSLGKYTGPLNFLKMGIPFLAYYA